jgi:hypothetical protein
MTWDWTGFHVPATDTQDWTPDLGKFKDVDFQEGAYFGCREVDGQVEYWHKAPDGEWERVS